MPVDVRVSLLAAQAEDVHPFGLDDCAEGFADPMHDALKVQILLDREIAGHLLAVLAGGDEDVPVESGEPWKKGDGPLVFVEDLVWVRPLHEFADEALGRLSAGKCAPVQRLPLRHLSRVPGASVEREPASG